MKTADGDVPAELSKLEKGYELLGELSRDEMLTVYVARDRLSGNEVVIKVLRARDARGREALAHYASDARLLTALEHPNIVAVRSVKWLSEDIVAVVTERVRGPSLRQVLDVAGTLPVARATEVLRGLGRALAWAHSAQIMHRDVRPENVIFEERTGRVVLSDFGLARRLEAAPGQSDPGADAYRAPELADGRYPDRRSDVYSLGIVGWELLTGRRPWPETMEPIEPGQRTPAPPPLADVRPGLPPALVGALEGAVQLDRDERIADVVTFMERVTKVAPPAPEPEEEPADERPFGVEPTEWVALPVPRMPQRPVATVVDREVPREAASEIGEEAPRVAESEPGASAEAKAEAGVEREVQREVRRDVSPASAEPVVPPPRQGLPSTMTAAAAAPSPTQSSVPAAPAPHAPADAGRSRSKTAGKLRDAPAAAIGEGPSVDGEAPIPRTEAASRTEPASRREPPALSPPSSRTEPASTTEPVGVEPLISKAPAAVPRASKPSTPVLSDVELPPPEPVPFADVASEPLRGPIFEPASAPPRAPGRFESMRGGLGTPRPPKERSRRREASSGPPAPPPLQPMWDTPAEFPLPVMPDPRPMPADVATGGDGATRRRWTRRGVGIAAAALLLAAAAVALARMERAPDTTAELLEPENPTGYGGDVVLTPRITDSAPLPAPAAGQPAEAASNAGGARRSRDVAAPAISQPTPPSPRAQRVPDRGPPDAAQPPPRTRSATPPASGATTTGQPSAAPTGRGGSATSPARSADARPTTPAVNPERTPERTVGGGPCNSPALADQRACLAAAVERSDAGLNEVYGDVVAAMRQRASTAPGDPDPPEVQRLRAVQRRWIAQRDAECRRRGRGREGPLWATPRAQCLQELSITRSRELSATLARLRRD